MHREEADLPGLTVVLLSTVSLALAHGARRGGEWPSSRRASAGSRGKSAVPSARDSHTPFKLGIGSLQLISVTSPEKPISVTVACLAVAALLHPAVRAAWQPIVAGFLRAGDGGDVAVLARPSPTLFNKPALYKAPYAWLFVLPGIDGVRVPARFWMLGVLCLA